MSNKDLGLKQTLKKRVSLDKKEKNIDLIQKQIYQIHSKTNSDFVRTTIHLPDEIHKKIKVHCALNGVSFKDFVTQILIESIDKS